MSSYLVNALENELSESQLGELLAVVGPTSADSVLPFNVYRELRERLNELGVDYPDTVYVDVRVSDVKEATETDFDDEWVTVPCGGIHFEI
jgi:hypothetical protein